MKPPAQAKKDRLAQALRENLKRRKARARALETKAPALPIRPNAANKDGLT
jgi:hypothetical protein